MTATGEDITLSDALAAFGEALPTEDLLSAMLPLFAEVAGLHAEGRVAELTGDSVIQAADGVLRLRRPQGVAASYRPDAIKAVQPTQSSALNIIDELRVTRDSETGIALDSLRAAQTADTPITKPLYLPGFDSWEMRLGHHDEITDVFLLGQILACLACGLDFNEPGDVDRFALHRGDLFSINRRLHPIVAGLIGEMTALNRHDRATDAASLAQRLATYRDQPAGLDVDRLLASAQGAKPRRAAVLAHLRDRLFDLSRRNRLLYFKPTQSSVNLTVASVPMVLRLESIRPDQLCTWDGEFAAEITSGKPVSLHRWLRFDDQPYLPGALDHLVSESRRARAEYGFSPLRLVIAFLRWNNLKEAPNERILSPLLWLPVELVRKKGVTDQYVLQVADSEAEFNPALRHHLRQLHDIRLPETVDLETTSIEDIHADLLAQIHKSEPAVELRLQTRPQIQLIHQKAVQRLQQFQRRTGRAVARRAVGRPDFSYDRADYRPLGLAIYEQTVRPSPLPLRSAVGAPARPSPARMAPANEIENLTYAHAEGDGHRFAWDFDLTQVTLANFNYKKMSLVRDYAELIEESAANPTLDRIFSIEPRELNLTAPESPPLAERWNVVAADATQNAAVGVSRAGASFIIQGPPGTGKSQTITNLIADFAARGKRVLFVCEKRAALDVVFHRLKQSGLDDLCCLIHDSQADKKAFIQDLKGRYEAWTSQGDDHDRLIAARAKIVNIAEADMHRIEAFETAMAAAPEALSCGVRQLMRRAIALPPPDPDVGPQMRERLPDYAVWLTKRDLTDRLVQTLQSRFGLKTLASHPFAKLSGALVGEPHAFGEAQARIEACEAILDQLDPAFERDEQLLTSNLSLADAVALTDAARLIHHFQLARRLELFDASSSAAGDLRAQRQTLSRLGDRQSEAGKAAEHWSDPLTAQDTKAAIDVAERHERSFLRFLSSEWRRLAAEVRRRYDFSRHVVRPSFRSVLDSLAALHAADSAHAELIGELKVRYGVDDVDGLLAAIDQIGEAARTRPIVRRLLQWLASHPQAAQADGAAADAVHALADLVARSFDLPVDLTLERFAEYLRDLREALDDLPDLLPLLRAVHESDPPYAAMLQSLALPPANLEALVAAESLARTLRLHPELAQFDSEALGRSARRVASAEAALLERNAALVRAAQHRKFRDHLRVSTHSVTQLDAAGRELKKRYLGGRRELEHEFGKTMRFRSIREIAGGDTGVVVNDLKPIWLMSPLSVSDTLPLEGELFDVVIFDEASQIPIEEAAPALSRAPQVIIVGDEMQLPPTSFFSTSLDEDDATVVADDDGERIAIVLDADSLLNQAARNLPATLLAWHYRSRSESLISFSNAAFYDGRLITVPDRRVETTSREAIQLRADDPAAAGAGAEALMAAPLSYHLVEDGVYAGRSNAAEARYIAGLVRELLTREVGWSLGVVAFSEAQQDEIESALDKLAAEDPSFAARLEKEYVREDDDQFNGLFVKNLENVQGDERDIILLSICYAPGPDGRMLMNFGPINQRGGEKRLNVIFSRAKHRMAVISTIRAEAITNTHNDGAAAFKAFLQFAEANARGETERSQAVLRALNAGAELAFSGAPPTDAFRTALASALRSRGHAVEEFVGRSQFRCDLAIRDPGGQRYGLAVLLDPTTADPERVRERYVFRPGILRQFGWPVIDILSADWLRDPAGVIARIEARLAGAEDEPAFDPLEDELDPLGPPPPQEPQAAVPVTAAPTQGGREFRFQEGASNKFWRVAVSGGDMTVTYGRVGTRGQSVTKTFDTPGRAEREASKLIYEKLRKGYVEMEASPPG